MPASCISDTGWFITVLSGASGATYAWAWDAPGIPEAPAVQELMLDLVKRYSGNMDVIRARAAVRPIIRRSQPVAGPIPGLDGQFVFSGLGSKG